MMSTYFGSMTIVLKFPLTRAASTNGRHRYRGLASEGIGDGGEGRGGASTSGGNVVEVGVGDRFGRWPRVMERLEDELNQEYPWRDDRIHGPKRVEERHVDTTEWKGMLY